MDLVFIASDHAGYDLKKQIIETLTIAGVQWRDLGPLTDERFDYPDSADKVCSALAKEPESRGILICGSGQGMAMRANKHLHIRAALCWNEESVKLSRQHNDANILCLGSRLLSRELVFKLIPIFLTTPFEGGRHQQRVNKLAIPTDGMS